MPVEVKVALIAGVFGFLGVLATAIAQVMQTYRKRKIEAESAAQKQLDEANRKLEEQERKARDEAIQRQIAAIEETSNRTQHDVQMLAAQVEKMRTHMSMRASESEEGIRMITSILSRDARTRSNLIHMYARTEAQLKTLMDIETHNLRFTKDTAATLAIVGELLGKLLESSEDSQRLRKSLDENNEMQQEFIDGVINAQRQFLEQGSSSTTDESVEKEIERINRIVFRSHEDDADV